MIKSNEQFQEALAALEHEQWMEWSKELAKSEKLSPERLARWRECWKPYDELTEQQKDFDRKWVIWSFGKLRELIRKDLRKEIKRLEELEKEVRT